MEKCIVAHSQSLLPLFPEQRGIFLGLEGVLQSWAHSLGTGAETGPPKRGEDSGHGPAVRPAIPGVPLLSHMIQKPDL